MFEAFVCCNRQSRGVPDSRYPPNWNIPLAPPRLVIGRSVCGTQRLQSGDANLNLNLKRATEAGAVVTAVIGGFNSNNANARV